MAAITSSKDVLLLLLYVPGTTGTVCEPINGRTRLVKMVFLFAKEVRPTFRAGGPIRDEAIPHFQPDRFGPFSADVYDSLEFLVDMRLVLVTYSNQEAADPAEQYEYRYWRAIREESDGEEQGFAEAIFRLTPLGKEFVEEKLLSAFSDKQASAISTLKRRCLEVSLKGLLRYVYTKYPEMATESVIRDNLLG